VAAGIEANIHIAMEHMSSFGTRYTPEIGEMRNLHDHRFRIFEQLQSVARQSARE
jgi:ribulose kinase